MKLASISFIAKARNQKQLYRLNETKSHSGGGFEICQAVSFTLFLAFLAP